jgi:hypothetical protein
LANTPKAFANFKPTGWKRSDNPGKQLKAFGNCRTLSELKAFLVRFPRVVAALPTLGLIDIKGAGF